MNAETVKEALQKSKQFIDALTVDSAVNIPAEVVSNENRYFSWDNEHRNPEEKPYLFNWSYYNGVITEGLYYIYQHDPENSGKYLDYAMSYLNAMLVEEDGKVSLNRRLAGYVDYHGVDCYKTASLVALLMDRDERYGKLAKDLYRDLTDENHINSKGHCIVREYSEDVLGGNYWHSWAGNKPPKYKVWLDGIYMVQPFLARYAASIGDRAQQEKIARRLKWVAKNLLAPNGLYYHAGNSAEDVCPYHWLRAIGWYAMAMADVVEYLPEDLAAEVAPGIRLLADGMLKYQDPSGMWPNVVDWPVTETNRLETSGTVMIIYMILKAIRLGYLDASYREAAVRAFTGTVSRELSDKGLADIYLMAAANNTNNYEIPDYYKTNEGKGAGPFIMAYSEMIKI